MRRRIIVTLSSLSLAIALGGLFKPEFFDPLSLLFVIGGALVVTWASFSKQQLIGLCYAIRELCEGSVYATADHAGELQRLTDLFRLQGIRGLENQEPHLKDGYLRFAVGLLVDFHNEEKIRLRLEHRVAAFVAENETNREIMTTLAILSKTGNARTRKSALPDSKGTLSRIDNKTSPGADSTVTSRCIPAAPTKRVKSDWTLCQLRRASGNSTTNGLATWGKATVARVRRAGSATVDGTVACQSTAKPNSKIVRSLSVITQPFVARSATPRLVAVAKRSGAPNCGEGLLINCGGRRSMRFTVGPTSSTAAILETLLPALPTPSAAANDDLARRHHRGQSTKSSLW